MPRRLVLLALALIVVAALPASLLLATRHPNPPVPAIPGDAAVLAPLSAAALQGPPLSLGLGAGLGDRLDPSMAARLRQANLGVLRFGDLHADDYDWQSGCSYGDDGQCRRENANILAAFLKFAGQAGAQPLITVNGEVDNPQHAAALVTYYWQHCIHPPGSSCPNPYWEIGSSPANWEHFAVPLQDRRPSDAYRIEPDQYAALIVSYAAAMRQALRRIDPQLPLKIVADEWIAGATDQSWTARVAAIDTHYAPLLYTPPQPPPSAADVLNAPQNGSEGRPGIDSWLQDLRDSLTQFNGSHGIIVGQWSIDANNLGVGEGSVGAASLGEPGIYGTYVQALFVAEMFTHFWQDAQPNGHAPLLMAIQYPITGSAQEPFDVATFAPRASVAVYTLVGLHFGTHPAPLQIGAAAQRAGIVGAAAASAPDQATLLLVNGDRARPYRLQLRGLPPGPREMWWIAPDAAQPEGVTPIQHARLTGDSVLLPPWSISIVQAGRGA